MSTILLKKGDIELKLQKKDVMNIEQTHDGIIFNLTEGLHIYLTDMDMPLTTKEVIINSLRMMGGQLTIDLKNYRQPTRIDII